MSYLVLARKYRPQCFDQVVQQAHVTQTLVNAISAGRVAHAMLFAGPRGTGKTTVARVLAKAMNCERGPTPTPCNTCRSCVEITAGSSADVFEIDGASNNGVEHVRDLRSNIKYMPVSSSYKIYIIDEVHMLSMAAFNALLKTLEEPPAHVLFMFATTEPHKIPITILSRCQRHDLRRIDVSHVAGHMREICTRENIPMDPESLNIIARAAGGSMRDALSLLDQIISCAQGEVSPEYVLGLLGMVDHRVLLEISGAVFTGDMAGLLNILDDIYRKGHDMRKLHADLLRHFRDLTVIKLAKEPGALVDVPESEISRMSEQIRDVDPARLNQIFDVIAREETGVRFASQPKIALEMMFMRIGLLKPALAIDTLIERLGDLKTRIDAAPETVLSDPRTGYHASAMPVLPDPVPLPETPAPPEPAYRPEAPPQAPSSDTGPQPAPQEDPPGMAMSPEKFWARLLEGLNTKRPGLAASLKQGTLVELAEHEVKIEINGNQYNTEMLAKSKNKAVIQKICRDILKRPVELIIEARVNSDAQDKAKKKQDQERKQAAFNHPLVSQTLEIFGGKIVEVILL